MNLCFSRPKFVIVSLVGLAMLTSLSSTALAATMGRDFGFYISGGLEKETASVTQPSVNATLGGFGNSVELGLDLPFSDNFGVTFGAELEQRMLTNTSVSASYLDNTKLSSRNARASFFYKSFYLGGSYQMAGVDLITMSSTAGASSSHVDLTGTSAFAGYALTYKNLLRTCIEGETTNYSSSGFSYNDYAVVLKLQFVFAGLFDHN